MNNEGISQKSWIYTIKGNQHTDQLQVGDVVFCKASDSYDLTLDRITDIATFFAEAVTVKLRKGNNIVCSPSQQFLLSNTEWVKAKDLEKGFYLTSYQTIGKPYLTLGKQIQSVTTKTKSRLYRISLEGSGILICNDVCILTNQKKRLDKNI